MSAPGPLAGLRVLEVGTHRAGSFAGAILADLGATVVKLEERSTDVPAVDRAPERIAFDRGKRSVAGSVGDRETLAGLLSRADVLLDELGPAVAGLDGAQDLIHCSITAFGPPPALTSDQPSVTGHDPSEVREIVLADREAEDLLVQALSGNMDLTGEAGGPPNEAGIPLADLAAGMYAVIGVLAAVAGGAPARVEVAKLDAAVAMLSYMGVGYFADGEAPTRVGTGHSTIFPYNAFRASDGEVVVAPFTQRFWRNFAAACGRADLAQAEDYRNFARRLRAKDALLEIFNPILAQRTVADWVTIFDAADVPCGPVLSVGAALEHEQTGHRGMTPALVTADGGRTRTAGSPFRFRYCDGTTFTPTATRPPAPGEHTEAPDARIDDLVHARSRNKSGQLPSRDADPRMAAQNRSGPARPLAGFRVLDLTRMFAGPCATGVLADLGAEVIKVEEPRVGDATRRNLPMWGEQSAYFMSLNGGKRSVTLDLKTPAGTRILRELLAGCDLLVENYRPGVMDRLGLGPDALATEHPALVYCSLSGFGATGPLRDKVSFDLVNQAMAGMIDLTGHPAQRPVRIGVPIGDMAGGLYLAIAALAGLRARERTGRGCWVDLSLHDVLITLLGAVAQRYFATGRSPARTGSRDRDVAPRGCYRAADGWLVLSAVTTAHWPALLGVLGMDDEPRFADPHRRKAAQPALDAVLTELLAARSVAEWTAALTAAEVPAAPVLSLADALESPMVRSSQIVFTATHPTVGPVRNLASPLVVGGERAGVGLTSPVLGGDTDAILRELGYDDAALAALADAGVTRAPVRA